MRKKLQHLGESRCYNADSNIYFEEVCGYALDVTILDGAVGTSLWEKAQDK